MIDDNSIAKALNKDLEADFPNTVRPLGMTPKRPSTTVTSDIEALKTRLDNVMRGIQMLKDQL